MLVCIVVPRWWSQWSVLILVIIKSIPKSRNVEENDSFITVIGLMPIYQSAEPFRIYVECTVWGNFFLLAFCHLPFMDEKLVPPSQLLHGLCPFVLSHKGSSLTFVFLQCVLTQVSRLHALLILCTRISVIRMFIYCKEGVPDQLLQSGDCITVCSMVVLQIFFFFFFLLFWSTLSRSRSLIYWMLKRFFCRWRHRKGYWFRRQENMPFASKCQPADVIFLLPCWAVL